jgi:hypothetical protein
MTVRTSVVWADDVLTQEVKQVVFDEVQILMGQQKTDGVNVKTENSPVAGQNTNVRTWIDLQTAEEWIIFINALQVDPVSTAILPD